MDLNIYDEYGIMYSWEDYYELVCGHSRRQPEPMKWVYDSNSTFPDKKPHLHIVWCDKEDADIYTPFSHVEYEETLKKARIKFGVYERIYGEVKYWNDPDYLFDWTEGEFT